MGEHQRTRFYGSLAVPNGLVTKAVAMNVPSESTWCMWHTAVDNALIAVPRGAPAANPPEKFAHPGEYSPL